MRARIRSWLTPATATGGLLLVVLGVIGAAVFVGGFNLFADHTNSLEFCISCHTMERGPYAEYKKTIHYENRTGVRAICSDCHVPRAFGPKLVSKIRAVKDVYHELAGTIDTPEKFEARRHIMASRVWDFMEQNQSAGCRNCHDYAAMKLDEQGRRAKLKHPVAIAEGKSCISCHKGIVHELPREAVAK